MNWLLAVVIAILVVNALIGMKVGLIKTIFSLCSMILALILTLWISPVVNDFMRGNEKFSENIATKIEKIFPYEEEKATASDKVSFIEEMKLPQSLRDSLIENNNPDVYKALSVDGFKEYVYHYLAGVIINAMAFTITFFAILIILWLISLALDIISKLPLLKQINKTAGLLAGLIHGLVVIWLLFIVLTVFGSTEIGQKAMVMIEESKALSFIYDNNFLLRFITSAAKMLL